MLLLRTVGLTHARQSVLRVGCLLLYSIIGCMHSLVTEGVLVINIIFQCDTLEGITLRR